MTQQYQNTNFSVKCLIHYNSDYVTFCLCCNLRKVSAMTQLLINNSSILINIKIGSKQLVIQFSADSAVFKSIYEHLLTGLWEKLLYASWVWWHFMIFASVETLKDSVKMVVWACDLMTLENLWLYVARSEDKLLLYKASWTNSK